MATDKEIVDPDLLIWSGKAKKVKLATRVELSEHRTRWQELVAGRKDYTPDKYAKDRAKQIAHWAQHPWNWLTGVDLDERPIIWTTDERDGAEPIKPYPRDKEYLRQITEMLLLEKDSMFDKTRQMFITTQILLLWDWDCRFHEGRRYLISRSKEEDATELLTDKVRAVHQRLPEWVQLALPQASRPAKRVVYQPDPGLRSKGAAPGTKSYLLAVAQNVAYSTGRGGTASGILLDEAAYQAMFSDIVGAVKPMGSVLVSVTTAESVGAGAKAFKARRDLPKQDKPEIWDDWPKLAWADGMEGMGPALSFVRTIDDVVVCTLDYAADPVKNTPEWETQARKGMTTKQWRREFRHDWTTSKQDAFYPEYAENGGNELYQHPIPGLLSGPIYCAWDFGKRHPALLMGQVTRSGRLVLLRELMPSDIDIRTFRDLVRVLRGDLKLDEAEPVVQGWVEWLHEQGQAVPWMAPVYPPRQFVDFASYEATVDSDMPAHDSLERSRADVLAEGGIFLQIQPNSIKASTDIIRELLKVREDGLPGLVMDSSLKILPHGLAGGLSYKKPTPEDPEPIAPQKDGYFEHLHDCLRYLVTGVFATAQPHKTGTGYVDMFVGRRRVSAEEQAEADQEFGWANLLGRWQGDGQTRSRGVR